MSELNLLEKTELWVSDILLEQANLTEMAAAVAQVLGLPEDKVMVVDVRPAHVTFDLVEREIQQENILGREEALLSALGAVPGVCLTPDSHVHSNGILGLICAGEERPEEVLRRVEAMRSEIVEKVSHRAIVFPTGFEVEQELIEDTNTPYLKALLEQNGYAVTVGQVIPDDEAVMTEVLSDALSRGFGLILTTGGVGAEDKDHSVESVLNVAPDAAAPYIVRYERGHGRHVKDGVRIGVGRVGLTTLVTLPGPHDEVEMAAPVLLSMLQEGRSCAETAERLAGILAEKWRGRNWHHEHLSGS
ncbi:molybdopterin-binding protein [Oscillospiraceae bacterium 50-60]